MAPNASTAAQPRVLEVFEPPDGGVPEHVLLLALGLRDHGFEPEIVAPPESQIEARATRAGVRVHVVPFLRRDYRHPWDDGRAILAVRRLIAARRPALVHGHASKGGAVARIAAVRTGVPAVYTPHCFGFVGDVSRARRVLVPVLERALSHLGDRIVCVSRDELRIATDERIGSPSELALIYYGIPEPPDDPPRDPVLSELRNGGPLLANVAALRQQKRQDIFLAAAAIVLERSASARLALVGTGPLEPTLHDRAATLGLTTNPRFAFLPFVPPVDRYLSTLDAFVLSSDWEALPISLLEAMAWGIPQIGTAVSGTPEIITTQTGRLVSPRDPAALAEAMLELIDARTDLSAMSRASRARHRQMFGLDRMLKETAALYAGLIGPD
jgi:glycosyltransferase involved in cell wall biosynthesis